MSKTIRIDPEVRAYVLTIKEEAEARFGRTYTWNEALKLALAEAKFPDEVRR